MCSMPQGNANQKFMFYVAEDLDQSIRSRVKRLVIEVAASRTWGIAPPTFIDTIDEGGAEVVGGMLEIFSALQSNALSTEKDSKSLEEVEELICAIRKLSAKERLSFEFQLDTIFVGAIDDGVIDRVLLEGLLEPWRDHIEGKS